MCASFRSEEAFADVRHNNGPGYRELTIIATLDCFCITMALDYIYTEFQDEKGTSMMCVVVFFGVYDLLPAANTANANIHTTQSPPLTHSQLM